MARSGKLSIDELNSYVFSVVGSRRREVMEGCASNGDCALLDVHGKNVLVTTDAITGARKNAGYLSIIVTSNDIAASGGIPVSANLTLLLPTDADISIVKEIMSSADFGARLCKVEITGGHTEFTPFVKEPVISCTMIGLQGDKYLDCGSMKVGDTILMTKYAGIEGTAIIAEDHSDKISDVMSEDDFNKAKSFWSKTSVLPESTFLQGMDVSSQHDATEGGILGAIAEMCTITGLGADIDCNRIPVHYITKKICDRLGLNPLRLISSGSLILTTKNPDFIKSTLKKQGIMCTEIGVVTKSDKVRAIYPDRVEEVELVADELTKLGE